MLALSPMLPVFGMPSEDEQRNYEQDCDSNEPLLDWAHKEWNNLESLGCSSPIEHELHSSKQSGSEPHSKKLNHNASERERRKKLNNLYSTLRSLLPGTDQKKKLSIPTTISHALKYIPQLQSQVNGLVQRKEEILATISTQGDDLASNNSKKNKGSKGKYVPTVSTSQIDDREVMIQICTTKIKNNHLSRVLQNLEEAELQIHNASAFASNGNKVLYTIHVQAKENQRVQCKVLNEKITSMW
ncbi:hypothetical protein ACHQM5_012779 [Ranunculus cassubicifolius]